MTSHLESFQTAVVSTLDDISPQARGQLKSWLEPFFPRSSSVDANTVWGVVNNAGTLVAGTGFVSAKTGTGVYTVTFDLAMAGRPAISVTVDQAVARFVYISAPSTAGFTVNFLDASSAAADTAFDFRAQST